MTVRPSWCSDHLPQIDLGVGCESIVICPWCEVEQHHYVTDILAAKCDFACGVCEREFTVEFVDVDACVATGKRSRADTAYLEWYAARHGQAGVT